MRFPKWINDRNSSSQSICSSMHRYRSKEISWFLGEFSSSKSQNKKIHFDESIKNASIVCSIMQRNRRFGHLIHFQEFRFIDLWLYQHWSFDALNKFIKDNESSLERDRRFETDRVDFLRLKIIFPYFVFCFTERRSRLSPSPRVEMNMCTQAKKNRSRKEKRLCILVCQSTSGWNAHKLQRKEERTDSATGTNGENLCEICIERKAHRQTTNESTNKTSARVTRKIR